jgi:hypothetical protein
MFFVCLFFFHFLFSLTFSIPPKKNNYMLAMLYKVLTISMILFFYCHNPCIFWLSVSCMYLTYFLIMHCKYLLSRTNMVMVICLSIVIDDLVTWNTWYAISYVWNYTIFSFIIIIIIIYKFLWIMLIMFFVCFVFFKFFNTPPFFFYMLAILYKTLTISLN